MAIEKTKNKESTNPPLLIVSVSICCSSEMIPPDWDMAEQTGSLWGAYSCYICKKCGKPCKPVDAT